MYIEAELENFTPTFTWLSVCTLAEFGTFSRNSFETSEMSLAQVPFTENQDLQLAILVSPNINSLGVQTAMWVDLSQFYMEPFGTW